MNSTGQSVYRVWQTSVPPIRNRIDMLSTDQAQIGIKVSGTVLSDIDATAQSIEAVAKTVPRRGVCPAERLEGGRYIDIDINREKASRYGMIGRRPAVRLFSNRWGYGG